MTIETVLGLKILGYGLAGALVYAILAVLSLLINAFTFSIRTKT
jgi:hypothetical protein